MNNLENTNMDKLNSILKKTVILFGVLIVALSILMGVLFTNKSRADKFSKDISANISSEVNFEIRTQCYPLNIEYKDNYIVVSAKDFSPECNQIKVINILKGTVTNVDL